MVQVFSGTLDSHVDPCLLFQIICKNHRLGGTGKRNSMQNSTDTIYTHIYFEKALLFKDLKYVLIQSVQICLTQESSASYLCRF